jgi:hypothetical protein
MAIEELTLAAGALTLLIAVATTVRRRRAIDRRLARSSVLTRARPGHSPRGVRDYLGAIRDQPALSLKATSAFCFFASYCTQHPATDALLLVGLTAGIGLPVGYVVWAFRR